MRSTQPVQPYMVSRIPKTVVDDKYLPEESTYLVGIILTAARLLVRLDLAHEDKKPVHWETLLVTSAPVKN